MIVEALNIIIACGMLITGALLWHKGIPAAHRDGKVKAVEILLLGLTLGILGVGRLSTFLAAPQGLSLYTIGYAALLGYALLRYRRLLSLGRVLWTEMKR